MSFAVVIPTLNEEKHLPRLLRSIKTQSLQPGDVVAADAGSTDDTVSIAKKFGVEAVPGGMPAVGRNRGAAATHSELIVFLDADVELADPYFFEKAVNEFEQRGLELATADVKTMNATAYDEFSTNLYNKYVRLWGKIHPHAPGFFIMVRRSLHEAIGGFDESVTFLEDRDYAVRGGKAGAFGFLETVEVPVSNRRQESDGRFSMGVKYILAELHYFILGPIRHNLFNYSFGHHDSE